MAAWKARGVVPALVEVTADIVRCLVHEEECNKLPDSNEHVLQLVYAMALTRWVVLSSLVNYSMSLIFMFSIANNNLCWLFCGLIMLSYN